MRPQLSVTGMTLIRLELAITSYKRLPKYQVLVIIFISLTRSSTVWMFFIGWNKSMNESENCFLVTISRDCNLGENEWMLAKKCSVSSGYWMYSRVSCSQTFNDSTLPFTTVFCRKKILNFLSALNSENMAKNRSDIGTEASIIRFNSNSFAHLLPMDVKLWWITLLIRKDLNSSLNDCKFWNRQIESTHVLEFFSVQISK